MTYIPLTPEQFQKARAAGFSPEQITANELKRKSQTAAPTAPVVPPPPTLGGQLKARAASAIDGVKHEGPLRSNLRVFGAAAGAVNDVVGAAVAPVINKAVDTVSNIPSVQKFASSKPVSMGLDLANAGIEKGKEAFASFEKAQPKLAQDTKDLTNILSFATGAKAAGTVKHTVKGAVDTVAEVPVVRKALDASAETKFNNQLNRAIPVLKKDIKTLPTKQKDARTALTDIVVNKDKLDIFDAQGQPKKPSKYNFNETAQAQSTRLKQVYKEYSAKLTTVDRQTFDTDIRTAINTQRKTLNDLLQKENSVDGRRALTKIDAELSSLRDTSPEGIQAYIESIGQRTRTAPGHPPSTEQIKLANLAGDMRKTLDDSVTKLDGPGYQELRNVYKAHKTIESQLLQAAKSELNKTPGWTDRIANIGITAEGINFLLTHDPHALAVAAGIKGSTAFMKWQRSPQRHLNDMFRGIEKTQRNSRTAPTMSATANIDPSKSNIAPILPRKAPTSIPPEGIRGFIKNPFAKNNSPMPPLHTDDRAFFYNKVLYTKNLSDSDFKIAQDTLRSYGAQAPTTKKALIEFVQDMIESRTR